MKLNWIKMYDKRTVLRVDSGVNPGDVKKREDTFGVGMPFPRVIPHSDGAGTIDLVGDGVSASRLGTRVWCFGAQSYRPFGTAAEYAIVPAPQAILLADRVSFDQGACLGIPGITAHRAVHVAGPVEGCIVLVQGGAGAVGSCAVALARHARPLVFKNISLFFLGSDDFPSEAKASAAAGLNEALQAGWTGFEITERFPLEDIALAHRFVERRLDRGAWW